MNTVVNLSKGFVVGYTSLWGSHLVNNVRYGLTRESLSVLGDSNQPWVFMRDLDVANVPNVQNLGTRFVLQGGTQNNLAVVKAEVDFIRNSFGSGDGQPEIVVHPHCGEAGAIGAAMEARRLFDQGRRTSFIGLDVVRHIRYPTTRSEETRCNFCTNHCLRTFLDIQTDIGKTEIADREKHKLHPGIGERRVIIAGCEKGSVEDLGRMRRIKAEIEANRARTPNLVDVASREVWRSRHPVLVSDPTASGWRDSANDASP